MRALFAGSGGLPEALVEYALRTGQPLFIIAFVGQTDPNLVQNRAHAWVRLGDVSKTLRILREQGITEVVMAGHLRRPSWSELKLDLKAMALLTKLGWKQGWGDDRLLSAVVTLLQEEGFRVLSATECLPSLRAPSGLLSKRKPTSVDQQDIQRGLDILRALGPLDVGQAVVIQNGLVLGMEAIEGTQALLERCQKLRRSEGGGVLVKCAKPSQTQLVDLPTVGLETLQQVVACGLNGLVVSAHTTQILDQEAFLKQIDQYNLFLWGLC